MDASKETSGYRSEISVKTMPKNFQAIIDAINEYLRYRSEGTAILIKQFLQAYSITVDMNIFDPDGEFVAQFYASLYELLSKLDSNSLLIWTCVDVLSKACCSCVARQALIHTYQFGPLLARFLGDHLTALEKKKLLRLMQELTCGIKLSWQIPNLPYLIKTLTQWIENKEQDEEIICLSLGVLVNICYKNLTAIYTFSRTVDSKRFLRFCLPLKGPLVEIHVCKLMIIVDGSQSGLHTRALQRLIDPTFTAITEALKKNDPVTLRLVIDFFTDVINHENIKAFKEYNNYVKHIDNFIKLTAQDTSFRNADFTPPSKHDPACVMLLLKLIYTIIVDKIADLSSIYTSILKLCLDWSHSEEISFQALTLVTTVTENIANSNVMANINILESLLIKLPQFMTMLESESHPNSMESCRRLGALLQLLRVLLKSSTTSNETLQSLNEDILRKVVSPIMSNEFELNTLPKLKMDGTSATTTDMVDTYIYAICLINEVFQQNSSCFQLLNELMDNKTLQRTFAQALYGSSTKVKRLVFEIAKYSWFPADEVASMMESYQTMFSDSTDISCKNTISDMNYHVISAMQMNTIDDLLKKLKNQLNQLEENQRFSNKGAGENLCLSADIPTRQVMELYEYKIAALAQAERFALSTADAAHQRATHMQHRLAQIASEVDQSRRHLHRTQQALDTARCDAQRAINDSNGKQKRIDALETDVRELNLSLEQMSRLTANLKEDISEKVQMIKGLEEACSKLTESRASLEKEISNKEQIIKMLEEHCNKMEKQLQKREEQIINADRNIETINKQKQDLQKMLYQKEEKLAELTKQYDAMKEVISTITRVASQMP